MLPEHLLIPFAASAARTEIACGEHAQRKNDR